MDLNKYKAVIFDLDGTLLYTIDDITAAINRMCDRLGYSRIDTAQVLASINNGARELVRLCMPSDKREDPDTVSEALAVYKSFYSVEYYAMTYPYPGVKEAITILHQAGIKLGVLSNKDDAQVKSLITMNFPGCFDERHVLGFGKYPHKPDPTAILSILDNMNVSTSDTVMVGDSNVDMKTAANAGIASIGVSWGYRSPESLIQAGAGCIIKSAAELTDFFI